MRKYVMLGLLLMTTLKSFCWGFFAHRMINYYAVFLLPPEMMVLYKKNIGYLREHAVDPDKRRYAISREGPRHYIDLDHYGPAPYAGLPERWKDALAVFPEDSLQAHGIVPWWIQVMLQRLTRAFRDTSALRILKLSAELGHYIADSHVPLHASSNHNGQLTGQKGIHGFWESRIPELLAEKEWDLLTGRAAYLTNPLDYAWKRIRESAAAADTVLLLERRLSQSFNATRKYAFEARNGRMVRQYSAEYTEAYNEMLDNMVERRLRQSIYSVASFWYTAWVDAGKPDLSRLASRALSPDDQVALNALDSAWKKGVPIGKSCD